MKTSKEYLAECGEYALLNQDLIFSHKALADDLGFEKAVIIQLIHDDLSEGKKYFEKTGDQWAADWKCLGSKRTIYRYLSQLVHDGILIKKTITHDFIRSVQYNLDYSIINKMIESHSHVNNLVEVNHD